MMRKFNLTAGKVLDHYCLPISESAEETLLGVGGQR